MRRTREARSRSPISDDHRRRHILVSTPSRRIARAVSALPDGFTGLVAGIYRSRRRPFYEEKRRWRDLINTTEAWSPEQLGDWQLSRLRELVDHAYRHVPFYGRLFSEIGLEPGDIESLDDVRRLPLLDKETLQASGDELLASNVLPEDRYYFTTGGSTGIPVGFFLDRQQQPRGSAFMENQWARVGYAEGDRLVVLRGAKPGGGQLWERDPVRSRLLLSSYHLTDEAMPAMLSRARTFRPRFLHAYPSSAAILARYIIDSGEQPIPGLAVVLCGSENLYDSQRELIERAFGCRVYSWYGQSESVALAGECEHSTDLHIFPQLGLVELLDEDGEPVDRPGGRGEIVATSLNARAMPLIRYRTMDVGIMGEKRCASCMRPYRLLARIEGRLQEFLVTSTGRRISMTAINMHSPVFDNVRQFRFVQRVPSAVTLRIVPKQGYVAETDGAQIRQEIGAKLGTDIRLELELVNEIGRSRGGKYHFLEQHLDLGLGDAP